MKLARLNLLIFALLSTCGYTQTALRSASATSTPSMVPFRDAHNKFGAVTPKGNVNAQLPNRR